MSGLAIITGASQGIGKSTAKYFLQNNWKVINISRRNCDLPNVTNFNLDLSDTDAIKDNAAKLLSLCHTNKICIVHNAATLHKDTIYNIDINNFHLSLEINVIAPMLLNKILLTQMGDGSAIIYIGSTLSEKAVPNTASYIISKHAVVGMMRATCQDLQHPNVHTCCICPGFTDTEMVRKHIGEAFRQSINKRVRANRMVQPEEIASLIYYCAHNPVINGSIIHANLGQLEL